MTSLSDAIAAIDLNVINDETIDYSQVAGNLALFLAANEDMVKILEKRAPKQPARRPAEQPVAPITPPSLTTAPNIGSGGSVDSRGSADSKAEHFTEYFVHKFVQACLVAVRRDLKVMSWLPNENYKLGIRYVGCIAFEVTTISARHSMKFTLGVQTITAIDDGGLSLFERSRYNPQLPRVLSIETKRKKHKKLSDRNTHFRHAAQIYAEMLGQVFHSQYYDRPGGKDYQEAFVVHARHATCYLFYARFPNLYLRNISEYGASYKRKASSHHQILLQQSQPYRMYRPKEQMKFFVLLAKLFNYMASGKSHIGILCNTVCLLYVLLLYLIHAF